MIGDAVGMKVAGPAADSDDYQPTYGPEDTENGKAKILSLDAPRRRNERVMKVLTDYDTFMDWLKKKRAAELLSDGASAPVPGSGGS